MLTIIHREGIKQDAELSFLKRHILANHKTASFTEKILLENKHIKNFCDETRHFVIIGPLHIHYDAYTWLIDCKYNIRIERIGLYDDFLEYNTARLKGIHSTPHSVG